VVVAVAVMLFVGPVPASGAALTKWDTIGAAWAYGGTARLLDGPNNGIDANRAHVEITTITALDPRRIRVVVDAGEVERAEYLTWRMGCVDRRGNSWSSDGWRQEPSLPLKLSLLHAGVDGRVQACTINVLAVGFPEEQPYQLRARVQAKHART
jgi:hypothetical protein